MGPWLKLKSATGRNILNPDIGWGELRAPQLGLRRSSRNRIWCILALKYDIYTGNNFNIFF